MSSPTSIVDPHVNYQPIIPTLHKTLSDASSTTATASATLSAPSSYGSLSSTNNEDSHALNGSRHTHSLEPPPSSSSDAVQVVVRIRPLLPLEAGNEESLHVVSRHPDLLPSYSEDTQFPGLVNTSSADSQLSFQSIQVRTEKSAPSFTFDHVFPSTTAQKDFYETSVAPLVQSCLEGYHATVLAYGQTGSGKTHSMLGGTKDPNQVGVIPRGLEQVFAGLEARKQMMQEVPSQQPTLVETGSPGRKVIPYEYSVKIQFIELYGEEFRDLLSPEPSGMDSRSSLSKAASMYASLNTRAGGPEYKVLTPRPKSATATGKNTNIMLRDGKAGSDTEVLGVEKQVVHSPQQALNKLHAGMAQRVVGRTAMNANSSRSHAIFTIIVQQTIRKQGVKSPPEMKTSKIHFVDLSGSESIKRSKTVGKRRKEGIDINKGLLVLGNVISALAHPKKRQGHVPYRDSKLTRLLKGSLGGNHKTLMIACVSPSESNTAESINTLRYANRAKCIQNHAKVNVDPASRVVNELRSQVAALAKELLRVQSTDFVDVNLEPEEEDEFLFSKEFLHSLMDGVNAPPLWRKKEKQTEQLYQQHHSHHRIRRQDSHQHRRNSLQYLEPAPSSDSVDRLRNEMNGTSEEHDTQSVYSVETGTNSTTTTESKLGKNIISYDFALSALRNTIESKANKTSEANIMDSSGLGLKTVRNIDELYQYLNEDSDIVIENDEMDEEESVYSNRVLKLNNTIAENEILLLDMTDCHEKYQVVRERNSKELAKVDEKIRKYNQEKSALENLMEVLDESSQYSGEMSKSLDGKEHLIDSLKERQGELRSLERLSDENEREIESLTNELSVMHRQKSSLQRKMGKFSASSQGNQPKSSLNDRLHAFGSWGDLSTHSQSLTNPSRSRPTSLREKRRRKGGSHPQDLPSIEEEESRIKALDEQISKLKEEKAAAQERIRINVPQYVDLDGSNHTSSISATTSSALGNHREYQWESHGRYQRSNMTEDGTHPQHLSFDERHRSSSSNSIITDNGPQSFKKVSVRRSKPRVHVLNRVVSTSSRKSASTSSVAKSGRSNPHSLALGHTDGNSILNSDPQDAIIPSLIIDERKEPIINRGSDNVICESLNGIADFFRAVFAIKEPQSAVSWKW